ncbi:HD-like signal output (HDOD) domain, no enzymatic activity [Desulfacinum hydrothermale DSM 13146]|uniref:HD-like signal output (HDOD) domain, no enzymatic activity n=1 Tax=Desulfacinum hydrothermale DSM 13146 TaxID=1121390 RepID=A0A1W1XWA5_9BACT|nr:HDOD domain-containing protein [Desulfacinum hydrothermale]SMC27798.1 HD-like signal output (HDOD) domain, no enzymatic activity [Desulfacinum hydrothermale DSM 13146]
MFIHGSMIMIMRMRGGTVFQEQAIQGLIDAVPTLPDTVYRVMDMMQDPQVEPKVLARVVQEDPGLALQTLYLCNSPYYFLPVEVRSIEHAVRLVGISTVCGLVMAAHFHGLVKRYSGKAADVWLKGARRHFLQAAECCRFLVRSAGCDVGQAEAFTVGLMHDIGKLVLAQLGAAEAEAVEEAVIHSGLDLVDAELQVLGVDHAEAGALLAQKWNLPQAIVEVVRHHHVPEKSDLSLTYFTFLADAFSRLEKGEEGLGRVLDLSRVEKWVQDRCGLDRRRLEELAVRWTESLSSETGD